MSYLIFQLVVVLVVLARQSRRRVVTRLADDAWAEEFVAILRGTEGS